MDFDITLRRTSPVPLVRQIVQALREAVLHERLKPGERLPSTRELAKRLGVARMVVVDAYDILIADGYAQSQQGHGTFVTTGLDVPATRATTTPTPDPASSAPTSMQVDFRGGQPALDLFPRRAWRASLGRALLGAHTDDLGYGPVQGDARLRTAVAAYVARTRGLPDVPNQVVITAGHAQASDLISRLLARNVHVAIEEPGPPPVHAALLGSGARISGIIVDESGLRVADLPHGTDAPRIVYVTPSHQYPTGVVMPLERRLELLRWADEHDAFIVEDDYDSEFRYDRMPPTALAALDKTQRVLYIGSFSKTMFPALRLGYVILPPALVQPLVNMKWWVDRCNPVLEQRALAEWFELGMFERHVRKMRAEYSRRRSTLVAALKATFSDAVTILGAPAGLHVLARFDLPCREDDLVHRATECGVGVYGTSPCYLHPPSQPELLLGFGGVNLSDASLGVRLLAQAVRSLETRSGRGPRWN